MEQARLRPANWGFAGREHCGTFRGMSTVTTTEATKLRPLVHEQIDRLPDTELPQVHRQLLEIELKRLRDDLGKDLAEGWRAGQITEERIQEAIREHRAKHPY